MPSLHHGVYTDEWGIGTTEASLDDFFASARASGTESQPTVPMTLRYEDDTTVEVNVYVDGVFNPNHLNGRSDTWGWFGRIDARCLSDDPALDDMWMHEGRLTLHPEEPANKLMIKAR